MKVSSREQGLDPCCTSGVTDGEKLSISDGRQFKGFLGGGWMVLYPFLAVIF